MLEPTNLPTARPASLLRQEPSRSRRERAADAAAVQRMAWDAQVRAMEIRIEARLTALQGDAAVALGGHLMAGMVELDRQRRHLAKEDVTLNLLLAEIEAETVQQVRRIHGSLFNDLAF